MKFSKTFGIFFLTFSIGGFLAFVFAKKTINFNYDESEHCIAFSVKPNNKKAIEEKVRLEIIKEDFDWHIGEESKFNIKLLEVGEGFHGDEVKAKSGERWLGLFEENGKFVLKKTKIKVRRVYDDIVDYETKNKTGKTITTSENSKPMFLLRNSGLTQGDVETLFHGKKWVDHYATTNFNYEDVVTIIKKDFKRTYKLDGETYTLKVTKALNQKRQKINALVLEGKGKRQVLYTSFEDLAHLYWIGDLDRDGIPDIYLSPNIHYNITMRVLFLSSKAKKDNLLERVAEFTTTGC